MLLRHKKLKLIKIIKIILGIKKSKIILNFISAHFALLVKIVNKIQQSTLCLFTKINSLKANYLESLTVVLNRK